MLEGIQAVKKVLFPPVLQPSEPEQLAQENGKMVRKAVKAETEAAKKDKVAKKKVNVKKHEAKSQPSKVQKAKRVKKLLEDPAVKAELKKKVSKKRDREVIDKITKAGGDDSAVDAKKARKQKTKKQAKSEGTSSV